jgi:SAM-dependent methyltransferase
MPLFEKGSFRDRSGRIFLQNGDVYRALSPQGLRDWEAVCELPFLQRAMSSGQVVRTIPAPAMYELAAQAGFAAAVHHERMPVVSWPYEWSFSMLRAAAVLQLELMEAALAENAILKDASAFNFQFRGTQPVLIDTGSIVPLQPGQAWEGYRQFCQMFLYPLMLQSWKGVHFQPYLRGAIEGLTPQQFSRMLSLRDLFRSGAFSHVWMHARLQTMSSSQKGVARSMQDSGFSRNMIRNNVAGLMKIVRGLQWSPAASTWSGYDQTAEPVQRDAATKEAFIEQVCSTRHWNTVWDLGCNQGRYSRIAARYSDLVLAMDSDHLTVDRLFQRLQSENNRRIVPLVSDLADPAPSQGWRGTERRSLEHRSKPDLVLCLALIHHLVIGSNLLLADVLDWLASLKATIVLEFVDRQDPQVQTLLANREDVFCDYGRDAFLSLVTQNFTILREQPLSAARTLFLLQPR